MTVLPGQQITWEFPRPYYEPGSAAGRDSGIFPVSIDGREYMVDTTSGQYRRFSVELLRTRQNRQPNENLLLEPEVWRSMIESWHQGAGQTRRDREDSLPFRFYSSKNIDPWRKWGISLQKATSQVDSVPDGSSRHWLVATPDYLVMFHSGGLKWFDANLGVAGEETGWDVVDVASDGRQVWALLGDNTVRRIDFGTWDGSTAPPTVATLPAAGSMLAYVKGFMVAAVDGALYDISNGVADSTTLIYTAPVEGHRWVDATDGLAAGYLLGGQGDKWFAYWITVRDDGATLEPPVVAAPLPEGEIGHSLGSYLGFVLIGTERGVRFCTPAGDNTLTYGRLIVTDAPVVDFEGQDRFVWFGIGGPDRDYEEPLRQPEAGLARLDLSTFTAPLTPAYASDLVSDMTGKAGPVVTFQGRRMFMVDRFLYAEQDTFAEEGWLEEGVFTDQVRDRKIALYASIALEPLPSGCQVTTAVSFDSDQWPPPQIILDAPGSVSSGNVDLEGLRYEGLLPRHTLHSDDDRLYSPRLTKFEHRSTPVIGRAHEWQVPLLIFDGMHWGDVTFSRDVQADVDHIISLVENGRLFEYREAGEQHTCYSPGYEWRPEKLSEDDTSWQGVLTVRIRSVR